MPHKCDNRNNDCHFPQTVKFLSLINWGANLVIKMRYLFQRVIKVADLSYCFFLFSWKLCGGDQQCKDLNILQIMCTWIMFKCFSVHFLVLLSYDINWVNSECLTGKHKIVIVLSKNSSKLNNLSKRCHKDITHSKYNLQTSIFKIFCLPVYHYICSYLFCFLETIFHNICSNTIER